MALWHLLCSIVAALMCAEAQVSIANSAVFDNAVSADCKRALETQVDCTTGLVNLATTHYFGVLDESVLIDEVCTEACKTSLTTYHNSVAMSCKSDPQPWKDYPATYFGDLLSVYQNIACQQDASTGQYCMSPYSLRSGRDGLLMPCLQTKYQILLTRQAQKTCCSFRSPCCVLLVSSP